MANISKRGEKWRAEVCIDRKRKAKSFQTKREAVAWANELEQSGIRPSKTLSDAIDRYIPIAESHKGYQPELSRLKQLRKALGDYTLERLTSAKLAEYRDKRLTEIAPVSVRRELITLSALLRVAMNEWQWITTNPLKTVTKPTAGPARRRGITQEEIDAILVNLSPMRAGKQVSAMMHSMSSAIAPTALVSTSLRRRVHSTLPLLRAIHPRARRRDQASSLRLLPAGGVLPAHLLPLSSIPFSVLSGRQTPNYSINRTASMPVISGVSRYLVVTANTPIQATRLKRRPK